MEKMNVTEDQNVRKLCGQTNTIGFPTRQVDEVRIPVPWGHISGKWWGPKDVRPILSVHGWQDNAGTYDTLIPLLPEHIGFLAIDLPGHGLSSWLPNGMAYHVIDYVYVLDIIRKEYGWDKVSLMGHSMGSIVCFLYSSLFPDNVDMYIALDALKPQITAAESAVPSLEKHLKNFIKSDERNQQKSEPPSYTYEELIERLHLGTFKSLTKECCPYLLTRNIKKSEKYPDKYYFSRDSRLKQFFPITISHEATILFAKRITMPHLFIKAIQAPIFEKQKYYDEVLNVLKENNKNFEAHTVKAAHHFHLTDPELAKDIVKNFIIKHQTPNSKL